jgi:diguanylate cyclase (GGDEF)-like protein
MLNLDKLIGFIQQKKFIQSILLSMLGKNAPLLKKWLNSLSKLGIIQAGFILILILVISYLYMTLYNSESFFLLSVPFLMALFLSFFLINKIKKLTKVLNQKNELIRQNSIQIEKMVEDRTEELTGAKSELEQQLAEIYALQSSLQEQAMRDPLTDLYNRRYMDDMLKKEFARAQRKDYPITLILFDIDFFKKLNDTYGHIAGDKVLETLGRIFATHIRIEDYAIRYGGEEFLIVLPQVPYGRSLLRGNQIRQVIQQIEVEYNGKKMQVTVSGGVAGYPEHGSTPQEVISNADLALYKAKQMGRNRIEVYKEGEMQPPFTMNSDTFEV